ncbi:putative pathogenesis-related protein [Lachnellula suecica]|uniref:Putative pathogenesis-related protein n=1 Tax=Lachnellula suecica TaxID=602035 RepID=A0A8T9BRM8_9HELO|nr:putative pathogenesis-related protein [Lachnellula suecica]
MHSASIVALLSAGLALASPVNHQALHKKALVYQTETDIVTVYVTAGQEIPTAAAPSPSSTHVRTHTKHHTVIVAPSSEAAAPSVVPVTSSVAPVVAPVETPTSIEVPATTAPSVVVVTQAASSTSEAAVVVPSVSEAPVVSASASSVAAAAVSTPTDYASTAVYNHNQHRANHTAADVAWNQTLADWAAITASSCVFAHDMAEGTANYGQNIAAYGGSGGVPDTTAALANSITDMWYYGEVGIFPFGVASPQETGQDFMHFSQAVWKSTQTVGCATQECGPNTVLSGANYNSLYTVCNYFPAGNFLGEFATEVTKSTDSVGPLAAPI